MTTSQKPLNTYQRPKWKNLEVRGNTVIFINEFGREWPVPSKLTETDALHLVSEIRWFAKCLHDSAEFNRLCRAGD